MIPRAGSRRGKGRLIKHDDEMSERAKIFRSMRFSLLSLTLLGSVSLSVTVLGQDVFPTRPSEVQNSPVTDSVDIADKDPRPGAVTGIEKTPVAEKAPGEEEEPVSEHVIASGDSLTGIAAKVYGRAGYWRVLKLYNDCDPAKLTIGQVIRVPDLEWLLEEEGVIPLFEDAADAVMQGRNLIMEAEDAMKEQEMEKSGDVSPDEQTVAKLSKARELLARARELFAEKRKGVAGIPKSMLLQLRTAGELMGEMAANADNDARKMAEVHERLGNAVTYCVIWAREGFN